MEIKLAINQFFHKDITENIIMCHTFVLRSTEKFSIQSQYFKNTFYFFAFKISLEYNKENNIEKNNGSMVTLLNQWNNVKQTLKRVSLFFQLSKSGETGRFFFSSEFLKFLLIKSYKHEKHVNVAFILQQVQVSYSFLRQKKNIFFHKLINLY